MLTRRHSAQSAKKCESHGRRLHLRRAATAEIAFKMSYPEKQSLLLNAGKSVMIRCYAVKSTSHRMSETRGVDPLPLRKNLHLLITTSAEQHLK